MSNKTNKNKNKNNQKQNQIKIIKSAKKYSKYNHIQYPTGRKYLTLNELDNIPYYDENGKTVNHKKDERLEQYAANDFVKPDMKVLKLGARYGTVSCVANHRLNNPKDMVVVEPDSSVIDALKLNKKNHKGKFKIYNGAISTKPLQIMVANYGTYTVDAVDKANKANTTTNKVKHMSLQKLIDKTKIEFDCLIADCEACLCSFVKENEEYMAKFRLVIFENDRPDICDYKYVEKILKNNGMVKQKFIHPFISIWAKP